MRTLLILSLILIMGVPFYPAVQADSVCTPPVESKTGLAIFEYASEQLSAAPLTEKKLTGWDDDTSGSGRGKWRVTFRDPKNPDGCYGIFALQDYETTENSLCRINDELTNPTKYSFSVDLTAGSPYAQAGYVLAERGGAFRNIVSWLGQYQVGTLVYCGENQLNDFHKQAVKLVEAAVSAGVGVAPDFSDTTGYEFTEAVDYIARQKIVSGYEDGTFRPAAKINRAEFTKIVVGALRLTSLTQDGLSCFSDLSGEEWFAPFVCTAKERGIVSGYPDGTYRPGNSVSVAEGLKIIIEALGNPPPESSLPVGGGGDSIPWYQRYIDYAKLTGIYLTDFTQLEQSLTRGQMVELIYRIQTSSRSKKALTFLVTEPVVDGGTVKTDSLPVAVRGIAPAGSTITVNGGYTLKGCCTEVESGVAEWSYNLKNEYGNIGLGTNNYTFTAKNARGEVVGESRLKVILEK